MVLICAAAGQRGSGAKFVTFFKAASRIMLAMVICNAIATSWLADAAFAEFRMSRQRPLTLPDPFLRQNHLDNKTTKSPKKTGTPSKSGDNKASLNASTYSKNSYIGVPPSKRPTKRFKLHYDLRAHILAIEKHFGKPVVITSGCRDKAHNRKVGGAANSYHLRCLAADIKILGIAPAKLAKFAQNLSGLGGVGTYCGLPIIHIDIGPKRQWHRRCGVEKNYQPGGHFDPLWLK